MKSRRVLWLGVLGIFAAGLIHLYMAPQEYQETPYMGILFGANFAAAIVAMAGIYMQRMWGWWLGIGIAVCSMIGYVLSRTVGLPGMEIEAWLQPIGVLSLVVEGMFIVLAASQKPWMRVQTT